MADDASSVGSDLLEDPAGEDAKGALLWRERPVRFFPHTPPRPLLHSHAHTRTPPRRLRVPRGGAHTPARRARVRELWREVVGGVVEGSRPRFVVRSHTHTLIVGTSVWGVLMCSTAR